MYSVAATHSPIIFIGTGEHMYDLDRFEPRPFVRKMLGMGDMRDLVEKVQDMKLDNKKLMKNLEAGERDEIFSDGNTHFLLDRTIFAA